MTKVYITTSDPITHYIYNEQESNDMFGADMLEDYGINIPDELLARYKANYSEFWKIQDELGAYKKTG